MISVTLAVGVAIFGGLLMQMDVVKTNIKCLALMFVMTQSQFTLLKSMQPDPASPTHGFNRIVSLSRPIYFCMFSFILLSCKSYVNRKTIDQGVDRPSLVFYSFDIFDIAVIDTIGQASLVLILCFPVIFMLGLLPQITTFIIHVLEQIDMHLFGSTASTLGLRSAVFSFCRSIVAIILLYLIALQSSSSPRVFSVYCASLIAVSYFLSRCSSDATVAVRLSRRCLAMLNSKKRFGAPERIELEDFGTPGEEVAMVASPPVDEPTSQPSQQAANLTQIDEAQPTSHEHAETLSTNSLQPPQNVVEETTASEDDGDSTVPINNPTNAPVVDNGAETTLNLNSNGSDNEHGNGNDHESTSINMINDNNDGNQRHNNTGRTDTLDRDERNSDTESISTKIQSGIDTICIERLKTDLIRCLLTFIIVFTLHVTTVFDTFHQQIERTFMILCLLWGFLIHFVIPQLRRDIPCICVAKPVLRPKEYDLFEVKTHAKVMWFEKMYASALAIEKNIIYPIFWINCITHDCSSIKETYGQYMGLLLLVVMSLKLTRATYNDASSNYLVIIFAHLFFNYDVATHQYHISTMNYFVFSILNLKMQELLLKLQFVYIYLAPWQIPWGSAFHAVAQPFSTPHSVLLFCQAVISSILSAPLQPVLGSALFIMSYVRPVKFWERDYNTNVIDINTTRLVTQLERNRIDSNRLDGIFYEHLTKCLQRRLCTDLMLGRWGRVSQGDCFIMASDNLNCLVHIIELGNGLCTFQLRGFEFRGTYCQQQEVEAITEGPGPDERFCCCEPGRLPFLLSANAAFGQLWLAWFVTHTRYVLEGYSISEYAAAPMLQPFDLRRALITYYVKAIIYFTITSPQLARWLRTREFHEALKHTKSPQYADLDPTFSSSLDLDFDIRLSGVTRAKFCQVYYGWISYCLSRVKRDKSDTHRAKLVAEIECEPDSFLVTLCYGLSLLARRSLSAAADGQQFHTVESLLYGLYALLKGDFRVTSLHDEWIFQEMRFFKLVVIPAVRMAMKLLQDHFAAPDDYDEDMVLYEAIAGYQKNLVISHETDTAWRTAILSGVPSLLTLRMYADDGNNMCKFIMLNRRYLSFRIIKINRECVRALWASQQQELIYFRNTDPERGSIQNAKQALRNMINSSCDQPVGYPIYVSPLTTSYAECGSMSSFM